MRKGAPGERLFKSARSFEVTKLKFGNFLEKIIEAVQTVDNLVAESFIGFVQRFSFLKILQEIAYLAFHATDINALFLQDASQLFFVRDSKETVELAAKEDETTLESAAEFAKNEIKDANNGTDEVE